MLIRGATLYDGTGAPGRAADVRIEGDRIVEVGPAGGLATGDVRSVGGRPGADRTIDAGGLALAPGFIDLHSHADFTLPAYPRAVNSISQGVTTEVLGNCGFSPAPLSVDPERAAMARDWGRSLGPDLDWSWTSVGEYLDRLEQAGPAVNTATLVGHGTLRIAAMGMDDRVPNPAELETMRAHLERALAEGSWGMSTGLVYPPATFGDLDEMVAIGRPLADTDGRFFAHIRSEADGVGDAVDEALAVGEQLGVRVNVSHLKAIGSANHGRVPELIGRIEAARARGVRASCDVYPYTGGMAPLIVMLPAWVQEGGIERSIERLREPGLRARIGHELETGLPGWDNELQAFGGWDRILISGVADPALRAAQGRWVGELASEAGVDPLSYALDLLIADRCGTLAIGFGMVERDVMAALSYQWATVGSDQGGVVRRDATVHPRCYGAFARMLGWGVREHGLVPLEDAIRKMTGLPADVLGVSDRGRIVEGAMADLVLFDPRRVRDRATFEEPTLLAEGIEYVMLNGTLAMDRGELTDAAVGRVLRRARRPDRGGGQ